MRGIAALVPLVVLFVLVWWSSLFGPLYRGSVVILDVYSSALYGSNWAAAITPEPTVIEERLLLGGAESRVTWWIPGAGERHPAILLVNGASPFGNDDSETRRISDAVARAGYVVMLPEFDFLKQSRFERSAPQRVDAAFAALLRRREVDPTRAGAFGFSVGGGILFAAAALPDAALADARYLGALGAYFDLRTYLASVVSWTQVRAGTPEPWTPDPIVREGLPSAAAQSLATPADRERLVAAIHETGGPLTADAPSDLGPEAAALWRALATRDHATALARLSALPSGIDATFRALSPATRWSEIRVPVYWVHDEGDRFEPVSEAERAAMTPHRNTTRLQLTRLLSHAAALDPAARDRGVDFWVAELAGLLGFATEVLRRAG